MQELRGELDKLLMDKIQQPGLVLTGGGGEGKKEEAVQSSFAVTTGETKVKTGETKVKIGETSVTTGETKEGPSVIAGVTGAKDVINMIVRLLESEDHTLAQQMNNNGPAKREES
jgi:hypothetical protein